MIGGLIEGIGWTGIIVLMLLSFVVIHYMLAQKPWRHLRARSSDEGIPNDSNPRANVRISAPEEKSVANKEVFCYLITHLFPQVKYVNSMVSNLSISAGFRYPEMKGFF